MTGQEQVCTIQRRRGRFVSVHVSGMSSIHDLPERCVRADKAVLTVLLYALVLDPYANLGSLLMPLYPGKSNAVPADEYAKAVRYSSPCAGAVHVSGALVGPTGAVGGCSTRH